MHDAVENGKKKERKDGGGFQISCSNKTKKMDIRVRREKGSEVLE